MSNNLEKIREMITSAKSKLASLTINPDTLDDIDSVVDQQLKLEKKIEGLNKAENIELDSIAKEQLKAKAQQRKDMLLDIAAKSEEAKNKHVELTKLTKKLIDQLVSVMIERETTLTTSDTGLNNPGLYELLTKDERDHLNKQLEYSVQGIYPGPFSATFKAAVIKQCADKSDKIKYGLFDLVKPPQDFHKPITGANSKLSNAAKQMSRVAAPEPVVETVEIVKPKATGNHYVADMRNPGPVVEI